MVDKLNPIFLQFKLKDIDNIFEALKAIPRSNYIARCKYRGGTFGENAACYFIVELTDEEASYIALKVDVVVIKLPRTADVKFTQNVETYYFEQAFGEKVLSMSPFDNNMVGECLIRFVIQNSVDKFPAAVIVQVT